MVWDTKTGVINIENRSGPRTDPCSTHQLRASQVISSHPLQQTAPAQQGMNAAMPWKQKSSLTHTRRRLWSRESNAALMLSDSITVDNLLSMTINMLLTILTIAVSVQWSAQYRVNRRMDFKQSTHVESIQVGVHVVCFTTPNAPYW